MAFIMGIDPGTTSTGVSVFELDDETLAVKKIIPYTIVATEGTFTYATASQGYVGRIHYIGSVLKGLLNEYEPVHVAVEAPFFDRRKPGAYGPLSELMYVLKMNTQLVLPGTIVRIYPPRVVKSVVSTYIEGKKGEVLEGLNNIPEIMNCLGGKINVLSEHAVDATAVAYTHMRVMRENPEWVLL